MVSDTTYFTYGEQTLHYFDRPHTGLPDAPPRRAVGLAGRGSG